MRKLFQIVEYNDGRNNACGKAPTDIRKILNCMGAKDLEYSNPAVASHKGLLSRIFNRINKEWHGVLQFYKFFRRIERRAFVVVQYPNQFLKHQEYLFLMCARHLKAVKAVVIIHDIPNHENMHVVSDIVAPHDFKREMSAFDHIIVHNEIMKKWFLDSGIGRGRLVNLTIFDYLIKDEDGDFEDTPFLRQVVIAGNLSIDKAGYLEKLKDIKDVRWELFGGPYDEARCSGDNVDYRGSHPPLDLPKLLTSGFGLVWDGPSVDACEGGWGAYLRINNPHKMSLYLAAGLPVITWKEAAQAEFILQNKVGFVVDSLHEIGKKLASMSEEEYHMYRKNAIRLAHKLRKGWYTINSIAKCLEKES